MVAPPQPTRFYHGGGRISYAGVRWVLNRFWENRFLTVAAR